MSLKDNENGGYVCIFSDYDAMMTIMRENDMEGKAEEVKDMSATVSTSYSMSDIVGL